MSAHMIFAASGIVSLVAFIAGMACMTKAKKVRYLVAALSLVALAVALAWLAFVTMLAIAITAAMLFLIYRQHRWFWRGDRERYGLRHLAISARNNHEA